MFILKHSIEESTIKRGGTLNDGMIHLSSENVVVLSIYFNSIDN
jgi:hypothetical protein